jgi:hypothetical protein
MNDEELEQRLHAEIQDLVRPPYAAPDTLRRRVGSLEMMESIRYRGSRGVPRVLRKPRNLAAAAVIAVLVASAMLFHQASPHPGNSANLPATFEMFGRIDANSAWAESGADLYITRDGGRTWTKGTIPGGSSLLSEAHQLVPDPATGTPSTAEPGTTANTAGFDHIYPFFLDADHGWLLSWTVSNAAACQVGDWSLTVWRTSDGARSWQSAGVPGTYKGYGTLQFTDTQHGWMTITRMDAAGCSTQTGGGDGSATSTIGPAPELATPAPTPTPAPLPSDQTTVLSTSDGGATWSPASTLAVMAFFSFTGSKEAWGYGSGGSGAGALDLVLRSVDGARTWTKSELPMPAGYSLMGIGQEPEVDGDLVTLRVEATATGPLGGLSATPNAPYSGPAYEILTFVSSDAGTTWRLDATRAIPGEYPNLMTTVSGIYLQAPRSQPIAVSEENWASGGPYGVFYGQGLPVTSDTFQASFDGGVSWLSYSTKGLPGSVGMAQWTSPDDVWVMSSADSMGGYGGSSYIYTTRDSGNTWTGLGGAPAWPASLQPTMTPQIVGPDFSFDVPTANPQFESGPSILSMGRVDANVGWVETSGSTGFDLRMTTDSGATWSEPRPLPNDSDILLPIADIQFVDANHGWLIASREDQAPSVNDSNTPSPAGLHYGMAVFRTADGGTSWQRSTIDAGEWPASLQSVTNAGYGISASIHFRDATHGEAFSTFVWSGTGGASPPDQVCKQASTNDGGATWSGPRDGPCASRMTFNSSSDGYGQIWDFGSSATVFVTSDGGQTWVSGELPQPNYLQGVIGATNLLLMERHSDGTLHALVTAGGSMALDVSADRGKTWVDSGAGVGLTRTGGSDYLVGWLGEGNWIALQTGADLAVKPDARETYDGGLTWMPLAATGLELVSGVAFVRSTDGWVVGQPYMCQTSGDGSQGCLISSDVLATSDGGQTWRTILTP